MPRRRTQVVYQRPLMLKDFTRNLHNMGFIASTYVNLLVDHMLAILRLSYMTDDNVPRRKILTQDDQPLTGHIYPPPFSSFPSSTELHRQARISMRMEYYVRYTARLAIWLM